MAKLIDGKAIAARIRAKVKETVAGLQEKPGLSVILVGDDPASHLYVSLKEMACEEAGIRFEKHVYGKDISTDEIIAKVEELNGREDVDGTLVQLPLPSQDADAVIRAIDPNKDVDGFHAENIRRLEAGEPGLVSPVALGVMKLIEETGERPASAVIVASEIFGRPIALLLRGHGIEAEIISPDAPDLNDRCKDAGAVIVGAGRPGLITGEMVEPGAVIIDIGTTKVGGRLMGDVDRESVEPVAGWLTPVPGGVGPMTVAMLLVNVLKAHQMQS